VNIKKVEELTQLGLMQPAGIASFKLRKEHRSSIYSYEQETVILSDEFETKLKSNKKAWKFFQSLPPSYRKTAIHWIMSAKQETTREKRLNELITESELERKIKRLNY